MRSGLVPIDETRRSGPTKAFEPGTIVLGSTEVQRPATGRAIVRRDIELWYGSRSPKTVYNGTRVNVISVTEHRVRFRIPLDPDGDDQICSADAEYFEVTKLPEPEPVVVVDPVHAAGRVLGRDQKLKRRGAREVLDANEATRRGASALERDVRKADGAKAKTGRGGSRHGDKGAESRARARRNPSRGPHDTSRLEQELERFLAGQAIETRYLLRGRKRLEEQLGPDFDLEFDFAAGTVCLASDTVPKVVPEP